MSILLGLLSLIISIAVSVLLHIKAGFQIIHFSLFFIVPVGAIIVGYVSSSGFFFGLFKGNWKVKAIHSIIAVIIGLTCFVAVKYTTYHLTCIDVNNGNVVYTTDGFHISNVEIEEYGKMNFVNYTRYIVENTPISFSRRSRKLGEVTNPTFGWILFVLDGLGMMLGAMMSKHIATKHRYCDACKQYKKSKALFIIPKGNGEQFFSEFNTVIGDLSLHEKLAGLLEQYATKDKKADHYACDVIYCEDCLTTTLRFRLFEKSKKNRMEENTSFSKEVSINYNDIKSYIDVA